MARELLSQRLWKSWKAFFVTSAWFWFACVPALPPHSDLSWLDPTFRSGEAFLYLIGIAVAVLVEIGIGVKEKGRSAFTDLGGQALYRGMGNLLIGLAAAAWGFVLVTEQPHIRNATTSWIQVIALFYALSSLLIARFAFQGRDSVWVEAMAAMKGKADEHSGPPEVEGSEVVDASDTPGPPPPQHPPLPWLLAIVIPTRPTRRGHRNNRRSRRTIDLDRLAARPIVNLMRRFRRSGSFEGLSAG